MIDPKKTSDPASASPISEAERMAKIRELLVGPAIADQSERMDKSVDGLSALAEQQREAISALQAKVQELEESQRHGLEALQIRLLGMVEALLADEDDVRARVRQNKLLGAGLDDGDKDGGA